MHHGIKGGESFKFFTSTIFFVSNSFNSKFATAGMTVSRPGTTVSQQLTTVDTKKLAWRKRREGRDPHLLCWSENAWGSLRNAMALSNGQDLLAMLDFGVAVNNIEDGRSALRFSNLGWWAICSWVCVRPYIHRCPPYRRNGRGYRGEREKKKEQVTFICFYLILFFQNIVTGRRSLEIFTYFEGASKFWKTAAPAYSGWRFSMIPNDFCVGVGEILGISPSLEISSQGRGDEEGKWNYFDSPLKVARSGRFRCRRSEIFWMDKISPLLPKKRKKVLKIVVYCLFCRKSRPPPISRRISKFAEITKSSTKTMMRWFAKPCRFAWEINARSPRRFGKNQQIRTGAISGRYCKNPKVNEKIIIYSYFEGFNIPLGNLRGFRKYRRITERECKRNAGDEWLRYFPWQKRTDLVAVQFGQYR